MSGMREEKLSNRASTLSNKLRLLSRIKVPSSLTVLHFWGVPPELTGGLDTRQEMSPAEFLIITCETDGVFLYRFDWEHQPVGDTWHLSVEDAKKQAAIEYPSSLLEWQEVSSDVADLRSAYQK